jgi:SAM-dependent methyltransferase
MQSLKKTEKDYYTKDFYNQIHGSAHQSAEVIIPLILEILHCDRVIDVGCGDGTWLKVLQENGVKEVLGVDGSYIDETTLVIPKDNFISHDLKLPLSIDKKFDLAMSLEVAEHLPEACAESFINSLVSLSDVILFSAAIPYQGGDNHINEQWQDYWAEKFQKRDYIAIDYIRPKVWNNSKVAYWYRQNILLFVHTSYLENNSLFKKNIKNYLVKSSTSLSAVHPLFYLLKIGAINWEDINELDLFLPIIQELNREETNNLTQVKKESGMFLKVKRIINRFQRISFT